MNPTISKTIREEMKKFIPHLTDGNIRKFKLFYAKGKTAEEKTAKDILNVIDDMDDDKLDHAFELLERTAENNKKSE